MPSDIHQPDSGEFVRRLMTCAVAAILCTAGFPAIKSIAAFLASALCR